MPSVRVPRINPKALRIDYGLTTDKRTVESILASASTRDANSRWFPTVSIVISFLNSAGTIGKCLECIAELDYPQSRLEVILVDAGSTDGSIDIVNNCARSNVRLVVQPGCSEPVGQDLGVRISSGEVIFLTNSDIRVPRDWISNHLRWLSSGCDATGGLVFWAGDKYGLAWNVVPPKEPEFNIEGGWGLGFSNCSFRKSSYVGIGGILDMKSQHDAEFTFRMVKRGGIVVVDPSIVVYHDHPMRSVGSSYRRIFGYTRNQIIVMRSLAGETATGPGRLAMIGIATLASEIFPRDGRRVYLAFSRRARACGIRVNMLDFLFIRFFGVVLGQKMGLILGAAQPRVEITSVTDLHAGRLQ